MIQENASLIIHSFSFRPDDFMEIVYIEKRDEGPKAGLVKTIVLDPELINQADLEEMLDTLRDFVDTGLGHIRNS